MGEKSYGPVPKGFENITFEDFRRRALDPDLSLEEKVGFPDSYRKGREEAILEDILRKIPALTQRGKLVFDIGPGCSRLPRLLMELCGRNGHCLVQVDSQEMLSQLPDAPFVRKIPSRFPLVESLHDEFRERVDVVLAYSLLQHVILDSNPFDFFDRALELLAHGGRFLLGDIPNLSRRNRFFRSPEGVRFHHEFTGKETDPPIVPQIPVPGKIDDAFLAGLLLRGRMAGFDVFLMPQDPTLPMANRREDILVIRP